MSAFTQVELEVMQILWQHGEQKPAEIIAHYPRPIKNPAIRSFLAVLVRKGHVTRRKVGKAYFYKARTRPDSAFTSMLHKMVNVFCSGSTEALVCRLIRSQKLTERQLLELKALAEEDKKPALPAKKKGAVK